MAYPSVSIILIFVANIVIVGSQYPSAKFINFLLRTIPVESVEKYLHMNIKYSKINIKLMFKCVIITFK